MKQIVAKYKINIRSKCVYSNANMNEKENKTQPYYMVSETCLISNVKFHIVI